MASVNFDTVDRVKRNTCTCNLTNYKYKHHLAPRQGSLGLPKVSALIVMVMVTSNIKVREILLLLLVWMLVTSAGDGE